MRQVYAKVNGVARRISALRGVVLQSDHDFRTYGKRFYRHKLLRLVTAEEVMRYFPKLPLQLRRDLTNALRRSTRAWLTRNPNLRDVEHMGRCRELWAALDSFSPKVVIA